jgi:hypothetical protein
VRFDLQNNFFISILYVVFSILILLMWLWSADTQQTSFNGDPRSKLADMVNGSAHNPFVQRALIPFLTRVIYQCSPQSIWYSISEPLTRIPKFQKESKRLGWELEYLPQYFIAFSLSLGGLIVFPLVLRQLFSALYETHISFRNVLPIVALAFLPPFFQIGTHYIYDFPALFFFTAGFLFLVLQKWRYYYFVFGVGLLNKETMVFLLVVFIFLYYFRFNKKLFITHLVSQSLIFLVLKSFLMIIFQDNPGTNIEFHLWGNIHNFLTSYSFNSILPLTVLVVLVLYDFRKKSVVLQKAVGACIPFASTVFFFGWFHELRDFYELFSIVF